MTKTNIIKISLFLIITCALDWTLILIFQGMHGRWNTPVATIIGAIYMFGPFTGAVVVQKLLYREELKSSLGISFKLNRWWFLGWLIPPALALSAYGISLLLPGVSYSPDMHGLLERYTNVLSPEELEKLRIQIETTAGPYLFWIMLGQGLLAGTTINALAAFGEEAGWRGFLYHELRSWNFWPMSLLIGFIWGVWHFPIILMGHNYPQHPVAGVFVMIAFCMLLAPLIGYIRLKSGSVIAAAIFHGTINGTAGLSLVFLKGGADLTVGITGAAGLGALLAANLLLFILEGKNLRSVPAYSI